MRLLGKKILVVGATSGIGLELTQQLLHQDCKIYAFSRSANKLADLFNEFTRGGRLHVFSGDLRKRAEIKNLFDEFTDLGHSLDGIFVTAGVSRPDFVEKIDIKRSLDTIRTNFLGPVSLIYEFLPLLMDHEEPTFIAGFTSMAADRGMPRAHSYSSSKAGLDRFLESLRIDLLDHNVRVFTIVPGYVETPMSRQNQFPMPGMWPVKKAAQYILAQIVRETPVIRFPWYHSWPMKLLRFIPPWLYARLMNVQKKAVRIIPQPNDEFKW